MIKTPPPGALWVKDKTPTPPTEATTEPEPQTCGLSRPLSDCALRRAGCSSLYDVLRYLYPPAGLLAELRNRQDVDPQVRKWLTRLDAIGRIW